MTKSIVTGGAGFIGSTLVDKLISIGHQVVCVDNEFADNEFFYWNDKALNFKVDITSYDDIKFLFKSVDYVFHCAAEARIGTSIKNPLKTFEINTIGTANVLQCSRENNIKRLIYSSTSAGYGLNDKPNIENQSDYCLNPYSVSKIAGEKICKLYSEFYGLPTIVLRYFNVYGERAPAKGQYAPVIGIFLRQKKDGNKLTITGDGEQKRDFVYVEDVVKANLNAAFNKIDKEFYGQVFNVGSGENISINQIAKMISHNVEYIPKRPGEVMETLADIKKIKEILGWSPNMKLENWIRKYNN